MIGSIGRTLIGLALSIALAMAATPARSAVSVQVAGNTATAEVSLLGVELAEIILTFDDATSLSAANLGLGASLVNPLNATLLSRLPSTLVSLPSALPLLITVEPSALSPLALQNTVRVEVHTHLLPYTAGSSLRLFKAPLGGTFRDITDEVAPGSVRTRGTTGGFSQFLVLLDLRPTSAVIASKIAYLRGKTATLPALERAPLDADLDAAEAAVDEARYADAIASIDSLRARVSERAGTHIPNQWSSANRNDNIAGELLAGAATLKFSVGYQRDYGQ